MYDKSLNQWYKIANLHTKRSDTALTAFASKIVATGVYNR